MLKFKKYHGLGNDFLVPDLRSGGADAERAQDPAVARHLCDRRFGVGGDGVLAVLPPTSEGADATMRVINADGSIAEMCGNGLRCVVKYLYDHDESMRKDALTIDTGAGPLRCEVTAENGTAKTVTVNMGKPRMNRGDIPMTGPEDERCIDVPLTIKEKKLSWTGVNTGNPHAVAFTDVADQAKLRTLAERVGPQMERHDWFPQRANVEFAVVRDGGKAIDLVVWERGCGITLACGTGACATVVAACLTGRAEVDSEVEVRLLGGTLYIRVAPDYETVYMRGPATFVYDADIDLAPLGK